MMTIDWKQKAQEYLAEVKHELAAGHRGAFSVFVRLQEAIRQAGGALEAKIDPEELEAINKACLNTVFVLKKVADARLRIASGKPVDDYEISSMRDYFLHNARQAALVNVDPEDIRKLIQASGKIAVLCDLEAMKPWLDKRRTPPERLLMKFKSHLLDAGGAETEGIKYEVGEFQKICNRLKLYETYERARRQITKGKHALDELNAFDDALKRAGDIEDSDITRADIEALRIADGRNSALRRISRFERRLLSGKPIPASIIEETERCRDFLNRTEHAKIPRILFPRRKIQSRER